MLVGWSLLFVYTRTDEELRKFLTAHQGKNFVKTHMKDTQRLASVVWPTDMVVCSTDLCGTGR